MAETALFSLSAGQVHEMSRSSNTKTRAAARDVICRPRELLVTLLCFNTFVNIMLQNVVSATFTEDHNMLIQVGLPFIVTLCCSDLLPKVLSVHHNQRISIMLAPFVEWTMCIFAPVVPILTRLSYLVARYAFFFLRKSPKTDNLQLLKALERAADRGEIINVKERRYMEGLIELQNSKASDIMWPRSEILYYNIEDPFDKLLKLIVREECSKIPVCQGTLDKILGVLYVKDLFGGKPQDISQEDVLKNLRKAIFVPKSMPAVRLLRTLDDAYQSMALVVDEYGNPCGLLTREDLLEVVVGEIIDRRDHKSRYLMDSDGSILASGKWPLDQMQELLGLSLSNPHRMQTLGGWLTSLSGNIPLPGNKWVFKNYLFEVLTATPTHVKKVMIRKVEIPGDSYGSI